MEATATIALFAFIPCMWITIQGTGRIYAEDWWSQLVTYKSKKGWQLIHCCLTCGIQVVNKVALDTVQPDDLRKLAML